MNVNKTLDVIGQSCPMPLLKTKKQLKNMEEGETLKVLATDPSYYGDIDKFCKSGMAEMAKHHFLDGIFIFYIKKMKK